MVNINGFPGLGNYASFLSPAASTQTLTQAQPFPFSPQDNPPENIENIRSQLGIDAKSTKDIKSNLSSIIEQQVKLGSLSEEQGKEIIDLFTKSLAPESDKKTDFDLKETVQTGNSVVSEYTESIYGEAMVVYEGEGKNTEDSVFGSTNVTDNGAPTPDDVAKLLRSFINQSAPTFYGLGPDGEVSKSNFGGLLSGLVLNKTS